MDDPYAPIESGMTGTVVYVDDIGTLHMKWDNGRILGICPDANSFEVRLLSYLLQIIKNNLPKD